MATISFSEIPVDIEARSAAGYNSFDVDDRAYDLLYVSDISSGTMATPYLCGPIIAKSETVLTIDTSIYGTASYNGSLSEHTIDLKDILNIGLGVSTASSSEWSSGSWPFATGTRSNYYFFVVKDRVAQNNGLLGYYMQVQMRLTPGSTKKTELFAVGTEIFESSK
jgi:hypothetical protein|tara:strand:+ start:473 stop:970 length:498 start_codon:yes stop_codon:yes gene_type:complete